MVKKLNPEQRLEAAQKLDAYDSPAQTVWREVTAEAWAKTSIACLTRIREGSYTEADQVSSLAYVRDIADYQLSKVIEKGAHR